ncbi:M20 peptidase aminoacylase family protein [Bacillus litorisediminis]|uniref:M20 peptidase aminoacylase family protein n=1 Tax=Bacillus litorisediminis TaxID=2922713 RepID=UPI001FAC8ED8|nr:M20 peptidase aminoacylase family protein [Bacillus litorisediminis]
MVTEVFTNQLKEKVLHIFQHLHTHPEVSWKEVETTVYIASILQENGCRVQTFPDCTGVIGEIGEGKPVVAVRADIDALWQEVEGEFRANHSCGHDAHMAMVLGVLYSLKNKKLKGTVRFIFQPAEEKGTGALKMVEKGVVDDADYLYGVHLRPIQEIPHGTASPVILHGAARFIRGKITGEDSHGARPHLTANAIEVGADLVKMIHGIHLDPMVPYSAKMTAFQAGGESSNIIPGSATFSLDIRSQTNEIMEALVERIEAGAAMLAQYHGVTIELETGANVAAAVPNEEAQAKLQKAIEAVLGKENVKPPLITTGGDDFHFYTIKRPHLKATMLGLGCDLKPGLHHPNMTFNHDALMNGVQILTAAIVETLDESRE